MGGAEHWTRKGDVRLFLWNKRAQGSPRGTILFVHGSSMASQPTFDLQVVAGIAATYMPPETFGPFMRAEYDKWGQVVKQTGATVN